jgi:hypothetical protein
MELEHTAATNGGITRAHKMRLIGSVLVVAPLLTLSCGSSNSKDSHLRPVPDQSRYEPLPAKHYLIDKSGNRTLMWAALHSVNPPRGSTIDAAGYAKRAFTEVFGRCPGQCFEFKLEVGLDEDLSLSATGASFEAGLYTDGLAVQQLAVIPAEVGIPTVFIVDRSSTLIRFKNVPDSFFLTGRYKGRSEFVEGSTSFVLGYKTE